MVSVDVYRPAARQQLAVLARELKLRFTAVQKARIVRLNSRAAPSVKRCRPAAIP
jgi:signal recognition particle GTPase